MSSLVNRRGGCHCGAVRFLVDMDPAVPPVSCNCSMCGRAGTLLVFVPPEQFTLEQGQDNLTSYHFNRNIIDHLFCKTCGIKPFARGSSPKGEMVAINVRCIDDIDATTIAAVPYDGKSV